MDWTHVAQEMESLRLQLPTAQALNGASDPDVIEKLIAEWWELCKATDHAAMCLEAADVAYYALTALHAGRLSLHDAKRIWLSRSDPSATSDTGTQD